MTRLVPQGCVTVTYYVLYVERTVLQRLRTPGSSLVASSDLDHGWSMLQRRALGKMVLDHNCRPGGRGLADQRPASCQVSSGIMAPFVIVLAH